MKIEYHPAVEQDVADALQRYDAVSQKLGDEFKDELRRFISLAASRPGRFHQFTKTLHRQTSLVFRTISSTAKYQAEFVSHLCVIIAGIRTLERPANKPESKTAKAKWAAESCVR